LGWFRAISLPHATHSENGCRGCIQSTSFCHRNILFFSQRTCPIHYFRSKTHVWGGFAQFPCRLSPITKTGAGCHTKHEFLPPKPFLRFSQRRCPIQYFRSKTHVWGGFAQFRCRTSPIPKRVLGCIQSKSFCHRNHFFVFRNEQAQSTTLGPKLCLGWFHAISLPHVTHSENGCRGAYKARVLPQEPFLRFSIRTSPIHYFSSKTHVWGGFA
jgi:hypothetical protein